MVPNSLTDRTRQLAHPTWRRPQGGPRRARPARADRQLPCWHGRRAGGRGAPDCAVLARLERQLPTRHGRRWATARGSSGPTSRRSDLGEHGERGRDARPATAAAHQLSAILGDDGTARWATASRLSDQEASWPIGHGDGGTRDWPTLYGRTVPPRIDSGHGNVCTASRPPRGVGGTAGGRASRQGYQLGAKVDGLALPRGGGPALGAGTWGLRRLASGARSLR